MSRSNQEFNFCFQDKMNRYMRSKHVKFNFEKLGKMKQKNILMNRYVKSKHAKFNFENLGKMKQKSQNIQKK